MTTDICRPIIGIENRSAQEVFDIMCDRIRHRTASEQPASGEALDRIATAICRTVAEIPDRSSPDDFPDAMLVTADELHTIVSCALENEAERAAISTTSEAPEAGRLREALEWYGEQARLARLIHSEGDAGRHALADDGGKRAREALATGGVA